MVLSTSFVRHVLFVVDVAFCVVLTTSFGSLVLLSWGSLGVGVPTPEPSWKVRSAQKNVVHYLVH